MVAYITPPDTVTQIDEKWLMDILPRLLWGGKTFEMQVAKVDLTSREDTETVLMVKIIEFQAW